MKLTVTLILALLSLPCMANTDHIPQIEEIFALEQKGNLKKALLLIEQLQSKNTPVAKSTIDLIKAPILRKQGQYEAAIELLLPLQHIAELSKEEHYQIQKELGINYRRQVKTTQAQQHYMAALKLAYELKDKNKQAQSHSNLGTLYDTLNDLDQSMFQQLKAQKLLIGSKDNELIATNFYNLANLSHRLDDLAQSEYFYKKALEFDIKTKNQINIADTSLQLAKLVYKRGDYEQALPLLKNAYSRLADLNAYEGMATAKHTLMQLYLKLENKHMALSSADSGLRAALKSGSALSQIYSYFNLIELHLPLKNSQLIDLYLSRSKELIEGIDNRLLNKKLHGYTAVYAELIGDYKLATEQLKLENKLAESLFEEHLNQAVEKNKKQLTAIEQQQRIDDEVQKNKLTTAQMNNQRLEKQIWLLSVGIVLLFTTLALVLYYFKHRKALFKAKLYQYNLLEKDKMLADISHELRTPLSVLKLHIEALELDIQENRDLAYSKINGKIAQLNNLISDVYQLSQAENKTLALNLQRLNAANVFAEYEQDMRHYVRSHHLTFFSDIIIAKDVEITVDKQKLDQILNNIFTNACLYTDSPGHVRLKVRTNKQELFIQVDDTSPGVGKAHIGKLFDRLYRVEESRSRASGGSGLGLSICQSFVELMSGSISALPGKSGGLCIRILLPLSNK